jgi:predicted GH43/DUF377 family glycosyl hydrolase
MFRVETIEPLAITGPTDLSGFAQMSPFVWCPPGESGYHMLARIVPAPGSGDPVTGRIWLGRAEADGRAFEMDAAPLIEPGPGPLDIRCCEDPTVVPTRSGCVVYYTGLDDTGDACLLYADGPDIRHLRKRGIAHLATKSERHTKEATVECMADDAWRLFFEYSREGHSRIGVARCAGPEGPWEERSDPLTARPGKWDCWHLSTGPLLHDGGPQGRHLMFYNGADRHPHWDIGWVMIDQRTLSEVARCEKPLIAAEDVPGEAGSTIAFAASLVRRPDCLWLYFTLDDRAMFRATLSVDDATFLGEFRDGG